MFNENHILSEKEKAILNKYNELINRLEILYKQGLLTFTECIEYMNKKSL